MRDFFYQKSTHEDATSLIETVATASHPDFNKSSVGHTAVASASLVLDLDVEFTLAATDGLGESVLADTVEMDHVAIEGSVVRITNSGAATESAVATATNPLDVNLGATSVSDESVVDVFDGTKTSATSASSNDSGLGTLL